ncbi:TetR/AcrR family transcriptional regulator [Flavobacterium zepuense]|uniref:TetR/AcrR family transcriptional regulator n=1 Tax=Flavobacterium zepuense TaxID=2593302 RepID=A0A552V846_9FLAO|nr:TetR/AcrR family transcriptional regulator [Flavobacterium zepuense]TRW26644.1 TetR/AcrR family transcriptional regulator [Flavobacterium zepuense]
MSKAEKTRQFIIEKTAPIFNKKGYSGTSLNDITEATGLTKGSIYGNFGNKDEVALAAFDYNHATLSSAIKRKMEDKAHPIDKIKVFLDVFADLQYVTNLKYGCPILNTAIEADDTHEQLRLRAANAIDKWYKNIGGIIESGQETGQIKDGVDAKEFAGAYIAIIEGGIMLTKVTGKQDGINAAVAYAKKMLKELHP